MNSVFSDPQMAYLFPPRGVTAISIQLIRSSTEQMFNRADVPSMVLLFPPVRGDKLWSDVVILAVVVPNADETCKTAASGVQT